MNRMSRQLSLKCFTDDIIEKEIKKLKEEGTVQLAVAMAKRNGERNFFGIPQEPVCYKKHRKVGTTQN